MRRCTTCGKTPEETTFYSSGGRTRDGLRAKCSTCMCKGGTPGPPPVDVFDRLREGPGGCWLWTGSTGSHGYGTVKINGTTRPVHRVTYERLIGEIPEGLHLDHLCRVKNCANPWHLDPVTPSVNVARGWAARKP